jgi:hypothetical protein
MSIRSLKGASCCLLVASVFATVPAFASDDAGAAMGATRIVSGTEGFIGPGGAALRGGAMGGTRIVSGTEDFVGPGGAALSARSMGTTRVVSGTEDFVGPGGAALSAGATGTTLSFLQEVVHAKPIRTN